jgi:hypothetical protein
LSRQHQRHRLSVRSFWELAVEGDSPLPAWIREPLESITIALDFQLRLAKAAECDRHQ